MLKYLGLIGVVLFLCGCESSTDVSTYACISHTRLDDNSGIDALVSQADLTNYDLLLLGGDMAHLSSQNDSILDYLETVFELSSPKTLWTLGNHDYTNVQLLKGYTKKETYYAYCEDKTVFIVLDTQRDSSKIVDDQLVFFNSIMDTISDSENIVLLTHKLIWMRDNPKLEKKINDVSNGEYGDCSYCVQSNNFYTSIYPRLVDFRKQNKQVFCVAGDIGFNEKVFEYKTDEGLQFLATGLKANASNNYFLLLTNDLSSYELSFEFLSLEEL